MTQSGMLTIRANALCGDSSSHFQLVLFGFMNLEKEAIVENGVLFSLAVVFGRNI